MPPSTAPYTAWPNSVVTGVRWPYCLASLANEVPAGDRWLHEIKWDGYRLHVRIENGRVRLLTRRGLDWTHRFPSIAEALAKLPAQSAYLDGEAIVENRVGIADFGALQQALATGAARNALLFAFDLLYLDGRDLRREPLTERKRLLAALLAGQPHGFPIHYSEHLLSDGQAMYSSASTSRLGMPPRRWPSMSCKSSGSVLSM